MRSSNPSYAGESWRALTYCVVYIIAATLPASVTRAAEARGEEDLGDVAARIQYAFYTADARALETVLAETAELEVDGALAALKSHHLAYGHWRLANVYAASRARTENARAAIARAVQACSKHAEAAIAADPRFAEAYAIQAVCENADAGAAQAASARRPDCRAKPLRTAATIGSGNPRVLLVAALCEREPDVARLREVVAAFESPSGRRMRLDWGHAEALAMLGQSYLTQGDPVAARDALERALVIAPDYRDAQQLLQTAAARPR